MQEALITWHMGRVFRAYRTHPAHARPVSQESLATLLGLTQAQLSRIEAGSAPQDLGKLVKWAETLGIPAQSLWFKLPHQADELVVGSDRTSVSVVEKPSHYSAHRHSTDDTELDRMGPLRRRSILKRGIAATALPGITEESLQHLASALGETAAPHPRGTVESAPTFFRKRLTEAQRVDGAQGPRRTLPAVLGLLGAIECRAGDASVQVRRQLLKVGAEGAEFAGWLYRDVRLPNAALYWYDRAMEWAQEAGDTSMQGYVLLKKSQMAYDERDPVRLLGLAQAARHDRWGLPCRVKAEVAQQEALGQAMLGASFKSVQSLLDTSRELLESSPNAQSNELGSYFNHDTLRIRDAITLTEAGKPSLAADVFAGVLAGGRLSHRDTGFFNARRAGALALSGEPDEAARVGALAADVAAEVKSQRTVHVLGEVLHSLSPWRTRPAVRSFRDALVTL